MWVCCQRWEFKIDSELLTSTCDLLEIAGGPDVTWEVLIAMAQSISPEELPTDSVVPTDISAGNPGGSGWVSSDYTLGDASGWQHIVATTAIAGERIGAYPLT